ncbi:hypothetical protein [Streptomyces griseosporeus]|uniref:hypothetical protein n=1 Tax=Streptomyces griseosporeus TaxID=1910 RepID=UPI0036FA5C86
MEGRHDLPLYRCEAVGDSRYDLPFFDDVGCAIAFDADLKARSRAHAVVDSGDIRDVLPLMSQWLTQVSA